MTVLPDSHAGRAVSTADGPGPHLPVLRSPRLAGFPFVVHGITGRVPGLGNADGNLGYGGGRDRSDAWAMRRAFCSALDLDPTRIVTSHQVHGADVIHVRVEDAGRGALPETQIGVADALIADEPGPVLLSLHADCLPILFVDPGSGRRRPAVGVAHAGWRGTVAGVAPATVAAMRSTFGTPPADLRVFLGPSIGACCYEVGPEVVRAWSAVAGDEARIALRPSTNGNRAVFDLRRANALQLERADVPGQNIETSPVCTRCGADRWFSHRAQGAGTGRFGAFVALREPPPTLRPLGTASDDPLS